MRIDAIATGQNPPHEVNVIIEVPVGGEPIKYEMDKDAGTLVVDRFLYTAMRYPGNYGFIPHTLSDDGDPCERAGGQHPPIVPGAVIRRPPGRRPVHGGRGRPRREDHRGAGAEVTQRYDKVRTISDLPEITLQQIRHFFEHYKDLEPNKWVKVLRWGGAEDAPPADPGKHRAREEKIAREDGLPMRRLLRILRTVAMLLVATAIVLAGLLAFNTVTNTSRQVAVAPLPPVPVDQDAAARRLAEATRWKTIASADDPDRSADAFRGLHAQIAAGFRRSTPRRSAR